MRRFALFLLVSLLAAPPASALADDQVTIEPEGREPRTLRISELGEPDVVARPYTLPGAAAPVPITGYSLEHVLEAANVDADRFGSLTIEGSLGAVRLSRAEATGATSFPEGPPVFYVENEDARFLRPARANGELAELASGGPMSVQIAARRELRLEAEASPRRARVGQQVRFTATVTGAARGERVEVTWSFGDGRSKTGNEVTHRFRSAGSYRITVQATGEDAVGSDAVVSVRVGEAPTPPEGTGGASPGETPPDAGAGTGSAGSSTGSSVAPASPSAPATPSTPYEPLDQPPQPSESGRSQNPAGDGAPASNGLESVEGIELADLNLVTSEAGRDAVEAARALKRDEDERDEGVPDGVWWFLAVGGLLSLGGLRELRRRPGGVHA
jgi:PKD domain